MMTYIIGYDLNKEKDYQKLYDAIKAITGTYWHHLDSTWIIKSNDTAEQIRNHLIQFIDKDDELLVIECVRNSAWVGFNQVASEWLKNNL